GATARGDRKHQRRRRAARRLAPPPAAQPGTRAAGIRVLPHAHLRGESALLRRGAGPGRRAAQGTCRRRRPLRAHRKRAVTPRRPARALHAADPPVAQRLMRRLLALWEKEWLALSRDVLGLAVLFLMPAAFIVVMSLALSDVFKGGAARLTGFAVMAADPKLAERLV